MSRLFLLAALALFSVAASRPCFEGCRFEFCDHRTKFWMPRPDVAFTGPICYKYSKIRVGTVDSSGEAFLLKHGRRPSLIRISKWRPSGLRQPFSPSFFKTYTLYRRHGRYYHYLRHSGVGRETYQQNQRDFLDKKCFILPLTAWQELGKFGNVVANKRSNNWLDCVAFRTRVS